MKYLRNEKGIKKLGQKIRQVRLSKNISMTKLAADAEIEYSQISRIERGIINTSVSHLLSIAKALKVHPSELFTWD